MNIDFENILIIIILFAICYIIYKSIYKCNINRFNVGFERISCSNICNQVTILRNSPGDLQGPLQPDTDTDANESTNIECPSSTTIEWEQLQINYKTNNIYREETDVYRNVNYYINDSNIKTLLYLGGTYEQSDEYNNIFCKYKDNKEFKYGTDYGGYYYRNECINNLIDQGYNIIQLPQINTPEIDELTRTSENNENNEDDCNYIHSDLDNFWYVYNDKSPHNNPENNNLGEKYNYDICGIHKDGSPDKHFMNAFFNNEIINKIKDKDLFIGGYSGGAYMTGRLIHESIQNNLKWSDNTTHVKFKAAFILSGTPFHCISPWSLNNQWCPKSTIDELLHNNTIHEEIEKLFQQHLDLYIKKDIYKSKDELKQHPPTIFFSPEYDDTVRKELVRYYFDILNKVEPDKHKIIIPKNKGINKIKHQWFGECKTLELKDKTKHYSSAKLKDFIEKSTEGMCDEIINFFNNQ